MGRKQKKIRDAGALAGAATLNEAPAAEPQTVGAKPFGTGLPPKLQPFAPQFPLIPLILLVVALGVMTWGTYGNLHIDFGRELYTAWRISAGDVLYRDIAWFNGPLSQYFNGLMFYLFGPNIGVLYASNLAMVVFIVILIYNIMLKVTGVFSAVVASLFFILMCAFSSIADVNNYNFIAPYSHEISHGVLLLLLSVFCMMRFSEHKNRMNALTCGLAVGLSALTKPEVAVATIVGIGCGLFVILRYQSDEENKPQLVAMALLGLILPSVVTFLLFSLAMPVTDVLNNVAIPLRLMVSSQVRAIPLYQKILGVEKFDDSLRSLGSAFIINVVFLALLFSIRAFGTKALSDFKRKNYSAAIVLLAFVVIAVLYIFVPITLPQAVSGQQFVALRMSLGWPAMSIFFFFFLCVQRDKKSYAYPVLIALTLCSIILLLKIFFRALFAHYGVFLLVPGTMLFIMFIFMTISASSAPADYKAIYKIGMIALLFIIVLPFMKKTYLSTLNRNILERTSRGDLHISIHEQGPVFAAANYLRQHIKPGETLAVIPQGVGTNYLVGNVNPTKYITVLPLESIAFGEENILKAYADEKADWVVVFEERTGDTTSKEWMSFAHTLDTYAKDYIKYFAGRYFSVFKKKPAPGAGNAVNAVPPAMNPPRPAPPARNATTPAPAAPAPAAPVPAAPVPAAPVPAAPVPATSVPATPTPTAPAPVTGNATTLIPASPAPETSAPTTPSLAAPAPAAPAPAVGNAPAPAPATPSPAAENATAH